MQPLQRDTAVQREVDSKGRPAVSAMTERELLEETVTALRFVSDKVEEFIGDLPNNPMFKMFGGFFR